MHGHTLIHAHIVHTTCMHPQRTHTQMHLRVNSSHMYSVMHRRVGPICVVHMRLDVYTTNV